MPWNGSGTATRIYNWVNDKNANIDITASRMDGDSNDFVSMINNTLCKDGQNSATANLPMAGFIHTGVGTANARNQYAQVGEFQDQTYIWCGMAGGTANAQTLTPNPAITSYIAGQRFVFVPVATNTGATTLAISGLATKNIYKVSSTGPIALTGGELVANNIIIVVYDGTQFQIVGVTSQDNSILRSSTAFSGASTVAFTTGFLSQYTGILFLLENVQVTTSGANLQMVISEDGGSTYKSTNYQWMLFENDVNVGTTPLSGSNSATIMQLAQNLSNAGTDAVSGFIYYMGHSSTTSYKDYVSKLRYTTNASPSHEVQAEGSGRYTGDAGAVNAIQFNANSGNITGTITMVGLRKF